MLISVVYLYSDNNNIKTKDMYTYNLTEINTITIVKSDKNTSKEWTFNNLCEVIKDFQKKGFVVLTNI